MSCPTPSTAPQIVLPGKQCLLVLVGPSRAGKDTLLRRWFGDSPLQIISADQCRAEIVDDPNCQTIHPDAFALFHHKLDLRMKHLQLAVANATNLKSEDRRALLALARKWHYPAIAVVLDMPLPLVVQHNTAASDRRIPWRTIKRHQCLLKETLHPRSGIFREGFAAVHVLGPADLDTATLQIGPHPTALPDDGRYFIIGDIHGCCQELRALLERAGFVPNGRGGYAHPEGVRILALGDLTDRGPDSAGVLRLLFASDALWVPGNHDWKLYRYLKGRPVTVSNGLALTIAQLDSLPAPERTSLVSEYCARYEALPPYYMNQSLCVAHAGLPADMQGRLSRYVQGICLYGDTMPDPAAPDRFIRRDLTAAYTGERLLIKGHDALPEVRRTGNVLEIDTGCVFGGKLTGVFYPGLETVQVQALDTYAEPDAGGVQSGRTTVSAGSADAHTAALWHSTGAAAASRPASGIDVSTLLQDQYLVTRFGTIPIRAAQMADAFA